MTNETCAFPQRDQDRAVLVFQKIAFRTPAGIPQVGGKKETADRRKGDGRMDREGEFSIMPGGDRV
jgi:hypothetical protein